MTDHEGQESMAGTRRPIIEVKNLRKEYPVLDETVCKISDIRHYGYVGLATLERA